MTDRPPTAAGGILALTVIAGAIVGGLFHQGSAGMVIGFLAGAGVAVLLWLRERARIGR